MQRMLTGLILLLVVGVAIEGVALWNLHERLDREVRRAADAAPPRAPVRPVPDAAGVEPARVASLERQLAELGRELKIVRAELRAARSEGALGPGGGGDDVGPEPDAGDPGTFAGTERPRDPEGDFLITQEDEDYFIALQDRVQRRRRVDGMTRNVMRRVERLAARGEIAALPADRLREVESTIRKYVIAGDDLVTEFVRDPAPDVRQLSAEERRNLLGTQRAELVADAQRDLVPILGETDALKVAEESLQNPWGLRRRDERRLPTRR